MTDTVNKQALLARAKERMSKLPKSRIGLGGYYTGKHDAYQNIIDDVQAGYCDESTPPTTPVQGYREALEGVHRILVSGEDYTEAKDLRSVITSATWACAEALSQTDIQPSKGVSDE
ncbi:hypothetical protein [Cohnella sp. JJ-181]|uniref:hypothetical protein n=1 Tax=Cohnella rhizoplanae TaxID=2974897 RepID=UPI0022FF7779|nr:hypothetical protein [Cohnella sp. JJ-181]CAI6073164.1 hypothetical protein COHCIP112018_02374 [Cohnella sp. JJ-181]